MAALPGQRTGTTRFAREDGPCPRPVRIAYGPFDERWLLPDHRLIDAARPELWRVADEHQVFAAEQGYVPGAAGPALLVTAPLPDGRSPTRWPPGARPPCRTTPRRGRRGSSRCSSGAGAGAPGRPSRFRMD